MSRMVALLVIGMVFHVHAKCMGRFVNPITDICWSCLFPITLGGHRISVDHEDTPNAKQLICKCGQPIPRMGIPATFWEPARLIDVTRTPLHGEPGRYHASEYGS